MNTSSLFLFGSCVAALAFLPGCGSPTLEACTDIAVTSVGVKVIDELTHPVTDATLKFSVDGGPEKDCDHFDTTSDGYQCGTEEAGHFVITATRGTVTKTVETDVTQGECHIVPVSLTITLPSS